MFRRLLLVAERKAEDQSDRQLLDRFVADKDPACFAALVERHGRLVFAVCRSVLRQEQDAEDAFQAVFLVLARMASSISKRDSLGSWLYGVALRTALKARQAMNTRRRKEQRAGARTPEQPVSEAALQELQSILHEEVGRLPAKYRAPFVLCCLEGKSRAETAHELGWKEGTVSSRIAQARKLLEAGLLRRGVALPAALTAAALSSAATANMPAALSSIAADVTAIAVGGSSKAVSVGAAALAQGVMQAMLVTKLKTVASVVFGFVLALGGGGLLAYAAWQSQPRNGSNAAIANPGVVAATSDPMPMEESDAYAAITGKVVDEAGKPVSGAVVTLINHAKGTPVKSSVDGTFRMPRAPWMVERIYAILLVEAPDGRLGFTANWQEKQEPFRVVVKAPRELTVHVVDGDGRPVSAAKVRVLSSR